MGAGLREYLDESEKKTAKERNNYGYIVAPAVDDCFISL